MSQEALLTWLRGSLEEERRSLDYRHQSFVEDMKLKLEALCTPPGNGSSGIAFEEVNDLSQITPKEIGGSNGVVSAMKGEQGKTLQHSTSNVKSLTDHHEHGEVSNNFQRIVFHKGFEWGFGFIIILHIFVMCAESQYVGLGVGHDIGYPDYNHPRKQVWPAAESILFVLDFIFGILYTIELLLKLLALRLHFIDAWNMLDVLIVGLWYVEKMTANVKLPIDTMLIRLLRLAKLLRLVHVLKSLTGFNQLFLMLTALRGSMAILVWVAAILFTCLIAFSLLTSQLIFANLFENEDVSIERKRRAFKYFGTFSRSLFSMFEMTMANWTSLGRFFLDDVNEFVGMTTMIYKMTMGFTVIAVINACFIKETFKIAEQDDTLMVMQKENERKVHAAKMMKLLDLADTQGDGTLGRDEFIAITKDPEVNKWLGAQGLRVADAGAIFDLIDTGEGIVHKEELVGGLKNLQGGARSLDAAKNHLQIEKNTADIQTGLNKVFTVLAEHSQYLRGLMRNGPQPSNAGGTEVPTDFAGVQGIKELLQEFSLVKDDIREVKGLLSAANLPELSTFMRVPRLPDVIVKDTSKQVGGVWGCT